MINETEQETFVKEEGSINVREGLSKTMNTIYGIFRCCTKARMSG